MADAGEGVEARGVAADRFRDELARKTGERENVALDQVVERFKP